LHLKAKRERAFRGSESACIARESATRGLETVAEARECLQGPLSINVGCESVVEAMKVPVEAVRVLKKAVREPLEVEGVPKEAVRVQHSQSLYKTNSREKVLVNCLVQAKRLLVDCRGLESSCRGQESVNRGRESVDRALRCFRGHESARRGT
jgi:hypothetical protein